MTYHPPSLRRQNWKTILTVAGLTFIGSAVLLLALTWTIATPWPPLSQHLHLWGGALYDLLFYRDTSSWHRYWQLVTDNQMQWHFYLHLILPALPSLGLAFWVGRAFYIPGGRDGLRHVAGPKLYVYRAALKHARRKLIQESRLHPQPGIKLHPKLTIPRARESGNLFVSGAQGTGKTVIIAPLIQQVIERGERAFIYDEKREFTAFFYQPDKCLLIAPWDSRSQAWNIQADSTTASQAQLIAEMLILDSNDPLWANGARMIFVGMVETLNRTKAKWGWIELADILSSDADTLHKQLQLYYPRAARFIVEQSKTTQSFFAQLLGSLGWIFTLADAWPLAYKNGFSITQWVNVPENNHRVILVQADKRYKDIGAPLANTLIALMSAHILSQTNSSTRELWLFLDELTNLPKNEALHDWMSLGRSKGCRIVAGSQSITRIKQIYSDHGADSLLNMFTMFISMRLGAAGETAAFTAKVFGEREVERPTNSEGPKSQTSLSWQRDSLPLVSVSDQVHLPQANQKGVEGFLLIPGWNAVYRLRWPIPKLPIKAQEHCPADWLTPSNIVKTTDAKPQISKPSRREQLRQKRAKHVIYERD